jgi:hypothetical protein
MFCFFKPMKDKIFFWDLQAILWGIYSLLDLPGGLFKQPVFSIPFSEPRNRSWLAWRNPAAREGKSDVFWRGFEHLSVHLPNDHEYQKPRFFFTSRREFISDWSFRIEWIRENPNQTKKLNLIFESRCFWPLTPASLKIKGEGAIVWVLFFNEKSAQKP